MLKPEARLLIISILLHHIYIVFLNTSAIHGIPVPDKLVWTALLTVFIVALIYHYLRQPAKTWYEKSLYSAVVLSLGGSILRVFGFSVALVAYSLLLIAIVILTSLPLVVHQHLQLRVALLAIYVLEFIILLSRVLDIRGIIPIIGPIIELAIVIGILYYNYSIGFRYDELFIIIIVTFIGWQLGLWVSNLGSQVPKLIISTMFEQMLSVGQYELTSSIDPAFFLSLHLAEVFNLIIVQILSGRSARAVAIILSGLDMTYPPIMAFRAIAILAFLRNSLPSDQYNNDHDEDSSRLDTEQKQDPKPPTETEMI